jgi:hypothetical protein
MFRAQRRGSFVAHALAASSVHNRVNALGPCASLPPENLSHTIGDLQRFSGERQRRLASPFIWTGKLRRTEPRASASGRWRRLKMMSDSLTVAVPCGFSGERQRRLASPFIERGNFGARNRGAKRAERQGRRIIAAVAIGRLAPISHNLRSKTRSHECERCTHECVLHSGSAATGGSEVRCAQ